jgi:hypothetical protein
MMTDHLNQRSDASLRYDLGIPQGWGPGPWDPDNWARGETFHGAGDIRVWQPGDPLRAARFPIVMHRQPTEPAEPAEVA